MALRFYIGPVIDSFSANPTAFAAGQVTDLTDTVSQACGRVFSYAKVGI